MYTSLIISLFSMLEDIPKPEDICTQKRTLRPEECGERDDPVPSRISPLHAVEHFRSLAAGQCMKLHDLSQPLPPHQRKD